MFRMGRGEDDRRRRRGQAARELQAIFVGKLDIQQQQLDPLGSQQRTGQGDAGRLADYLDIRMRAQQVAQLLTAERTAQARLEAVKAVQQVQQLRLLHAEVLAPDNGVINARSATLGAVVPAGSELFRLIRQGRLEWRGEVAAAELAQIRRGQKVKVDGGGAPVTGAVRQVAPTVDAATRNALVYVDLPDTGGRLKAGMFARGEFATGSSTALTLPQSAVLLRDGFSYVFTVGADGRVAQGKVTTGRRSGDRIEILQGLDEKARVVASGGGFLADGDTVRVVEAAPVVKSTALK